MATVAARIAAAQRENTTVSAESQRASSNPLRAGLLGASSSLAQFEDRPIERIEVDGTALLKIVRGGSGHLLGIDDKGTLLISDAFGLPSGSLFPAAERLNPDDRDRDASFRRKDDSFDAAYSAAYAHASAYLPRIAELGADANVVGLFTTTHNAATTSTTGQSGAPSGALVEALVRYQLGGSIEGASTAASSVKPKSTLGRPPRAPGAGVALVCDGASGQAAVGALSIKAYRISEDYLAALKAGRLDAQALADHAIAPTNVLRELPVTITSSSLLAGALATYAAAPVAPSPDDPSTSSTSGSIPHIPAHSLKTLSTPATSLTQPLQNLLTSFEASANVLANMRFRDRKSGKPGQETQDALRSLAAADAASKSLSAASGIALVRAYGARSAVDVSASS